MRRPPPSRRYRRGFTLIEMAVVIVIIGFVVSSAVTFLSAFSDGRGLSTTSEKLDRIENAIRLHAIRYRCLPCPTDGSLASSNANAGLAVDSVGTVAVGSCATGTCVLTNGVVPWKNLGLSEQDITDAWGDRIRYGVAGSVTTGVGTCPATAGNLQITSGINRVVPASTGCYPIGNLTVNDLDSGTSTTNAAYVLISSGPDKALARKATTGTLTGNRYSQSSGGQFENQNGDTTFSTGKTNSNTSAAHFDDIVRFATAANIVQLCGSNACGNPAASP